MSWIFQRTDLNGECEGIVKFSLSRYIALQMYKNNKMEGGVVVVDRVVPSLHSKYGTFMFIKPK